MRCLTSENEDKLPSQTLRETGLFVAFVRWSCKSCIPSGSIPLLYGTTELTWQVFKLWPRRQLCSRAQISSGGRNSSQSPERYPQVMSCHFQRHHEMACRNLVKGNMIRLLGQIQLRSESGVKKAQKPSRITLLPFSLSAPPLWH